MYILNLKRKGIKTGTNIKHETKELVKKYYWPNCIYSNQLSPLLLSYGS